MAFGHLGEGSDDAELSEINVVPLVDVMLVLLILFIITAPLFTPHAFQIEIPQASTEQTEVEPDIIALAIDAESQLFWGDDAMDEESLLQRLSESATQTPQPVIHLRADKNTPYQRIADVLEVVKQSGMEQLGFVTAGES